MNRKDDQAIGAERRNFLRVPFGAEVICRWGAGQSGQARCTDVSHGGVSLQTPRPLRLEQFVLVSFNTLKTCDDSIELKGQVVWTRSLDDTAHLAGLRVFHDEPEVVFALSDLVYAAALTGRHGLPGAGIHPNVPAAAQHCIKIAKGETNLCRTQLGREAELFALS